MPGINVAQYASDPRSVLIDDNNDNSNAKSHADMDEKAKNRRHSLLHVKQLIEKFFILFFNSFPSDVALRLEQELEIIGDEETMDYVLQSEATF